MESQAGHIVVGYDGSEQSAQALDWAAAEAERRNLPLTVLNVVDYLGMIPGPEGVAPWPWPSMAEKVAAHVAAEGVQVAAEGVHRARKTAGSIEISAVTHVARVAYSLIASSQDAALLVVGTRGHGEVAGALLGSVAFAVSAHAHCPVVIVRGDSSRSSGPHGPVLVGADGSTCSEAAVRYAADVAASTSAPLVVVTAYRSAASQAWATTLPYTLESSGGPTFDTIAREAAEEVTAAAVRTALELHPELEVREQVLEGAAAGTLAAAAVGCGLLVVGSRGHGGFAGLMLGSVSHGAIHSAPCPVAIVHGWTEPAETVGEPTR
jgi:nucleotide-binding universal stress UspA family protein